MDQSPVGALLDAGALLRTVAGPVPETIPDVVAMMTAIDELLPAGDGLKWFNMLYRDVTRAVDQSTQTGRWHRPEWLERLDVEFAGLYFKAIASWYQDRPGTPRAWADLFAARFRPGVARIQFAIAGMNAHINHDLPFAVIATSRAMNVVPDDDTPEHLDYQAVNAVLERVEPDALRFLATGIAGHVMEDLGALGRHMAMWSIRGARDVAWTNARVLWRLEASSLQEAARAYAAELNGSTGILGAGILAPL
ncbi:MAG TPA: DUF5995 family protein [Candidatus Kapabacteria bacterium]|nr:DUF5995 family protein [Candidatus Kapabacteria bacterium]